MNNFLKVALFSLFIIGVYTVYSVMIIPPITPEEPPKEEAAAMPVTVDELVALGEQVYNGKGACALCHSPVAGRAPLLEKAAAVAEARLREKGYNGKATDAEEYLYESLVAPSAFVVPGFGASGTNDTISPMPGVKDPAIGLSETEIKAVIAYLQQIAGVEVTVKLDGGNAIQEASGR
ncbi:MAG: c-type cytochrome [Deltaproteobacteria bacterium]|nr:c-type cytochrome [Deltaproteobacteria bacterium]